MQAFELDLNICTDFVLLMKLLIYLKSDFGDQLICLELAVPYLDRMALIPKIIFYLLALLRADEDHNNPMDLNSHLYNSSLS